MRECFHTKQSANHDPQNGGINMLPIQSTCPRCNSCHIEMAEIVRIEPVGHELGMLVYECPRCKKTKTIFFDRKHAQPAQ